MADPEVPAEAGAAEAAEAGAAEAASVEAASAAVVPAAAEAAAGRARNYPSEAYGLRLVAATQRH